MEKEPITLYDRVKTSLKEGVLNGKISIGEQLSPEPVLCRHHGVSRITLRRAITELCSEGLLKKIHGKGTFVVTNQSKLTTGRIWKIIISSKNLYNPKSIFSYPIFHSISNFARQYGYETIFTEVTTSGWESQLKQDTKNGVAAFCFMLEDSSNSTAFLKINRFISEIKSRKIPVVIMQRVPKNKKVDAVWTDNYYGGFMATQHLLEHGFKKIAYLSSPSNPYNFLRLSGYRDALKKRKIRNVIIKEIKNYKGDNWGYQEVKELIQKEKPEAVFAFHDRTAVQVLWTANSLGIKVPEELAVVGYDDLNDFYGPPIGLTSVNQNFSQVAKLTAELLLKRLKRNWEYFPEKIEVKPNLVIRRSCGCNHQSSP